MSRPDTLPLSFDSENIKHPLYFDDAGAADDEPAKGILIGHVRAWHDQIERLKEVITPFVNIRDQSPQNMAKIIHKGLDGLTPIDLTVTKNQFMDAWLLWNALKDNP